MGVGDVGLRLQHGAGWGCELGLARAHLGVGGDASCWSFEWALATLALDFSKPCSFLASRAGFFFFNWQGFQPQQARREAASAPSPISPALLLLPCRAGQTQD